MSRVHDDTSGLVQVPADQYAELHQTATKLTRILVGTAIKNHGRDPQRWPHNPLTDLVRQATTVLRSLPAA